MTEPAIDFDALMPAEFDALHATLSEWDVVRMLESWRRPPDPEFTRGRTSPCPGDGFVWVIRACGRLAGTIGITEGSLGYMIAPDHWGRGIATAAVHAATDKAFGQSGLGRITANVWADNPASVRVPEKSGFEETGTGQTIVQARGEPVGSRVFVLTRTAWSLRGPGGSATARAGRGD